MIDSSVSRTLAGIALTFALVACGGDSGTTEPAVPVVPVVPKVDANTKVTALLTEITNGQSAASQSLSAGGVPSASPAPTSSPAPLFTTTPADNAAACVLDSLTVRFNCPSNTDLQGIVTTSYFQLLDSAGLAQKAFDTVTTVAVRRVRDRAGAVASPLMTQTGPIPAIDTIKNHDDLVLSGIKTPSHRLDGTGSMNVVLVPEGQPVVHITAPTTTANLAFVHDSTRPYPISGTITATVTSTRTGSPSTTTTQVTTYDGTAIAKLVITLLNGTTRTCTYNMTTPNTPATCTP